MKKGIQISCASKIKEVLLNALRNNPYVLKEGIVKAVNDFRRWSQISFEKN